jgi:hypothetical protein
MAARNSWALPHAVRRVEMEASGTALLATAAAAAEPGSAAEAGPGSDGASSGGAVSVCEAGGATDAAAAAGSGAALEKWRTSRGWAQRLLVKGRW